MTGRDRAGVGLVLFGLVCTLIASGIGLYAVGWLIAQGLR